MLCFRGVINGRALIFLAAPLLVAGTMLWQRQSPVASGTSAKPEPDVAQSRPPLGVSPAEWETAREEFEGLADSTFQCGVEEMPAYWRLLKWSVRQPDSDEERNQFSKVPFNDLVNRPSLLRGVPVQVELHVCRIGSYAAPENSLGIERLYEVWGWSDDSRGSLYVAVTPDLPSGMHTGEVVNERATLYGYFYKVQGYLAAGSAPQEFPSAAPLIIGRLVPWHAPLTVVASGNEIWLTAVGLLLAVSLVWLISQKSSFRRHQQKPMEQLAPSASAKLEAWLDGDGILPLHQVSEYSYFKQ